MVGRRMLLLTSFWTLLLAGSASAAPLAGSVHDLSTVPSAGDRPSGGPGTLRACSFCHTPHTSERQSRPLWTRQEASESFSVGTLPEDDPAAQPTAGLSSTLCQSCHDGSVALDAMSAPKYTAAVVGGNSTTVDLGAPAEANLLASLQPTGSHPVGVPYLPAPDLVPAPIDGKFPNGVRLIDGRVECASCHNPHSTTAPPFLAAPNAGSALCYTCHVK